ncbi:MAG: hypothetical protein LJF04_17825, partial [Gemmatimonadetes bacterium]|nr:hypothetical protein [Gemmatimonadota bacterium]
VQLSFTPTFSSWDHRYGLSTSGGSSEVQPLGADLTDPAGVSPFPGIALLKEDLAALTGQGDFTPTIGSLSGLVTKNVTRLESGLRLGVFDWLTLGAMVPYVKTRTAIDVAFHPDSAGATLGMNPLTDEVGSSAVSDVLGGLETAVAAAQSQADAACAAGSGASCSDAQAFSQRVATFSTRMHQAYFATPFFPREGSAMADALAAGLQALNNDLTAAGLSAVGYPLVFATDVVDESKFLDLTTNPPAGIIGSPLETSMGIWTLGDIELTADLRLLNGEIRDSAAVWPRVAWTVTGGVLVRLGTGKPAAPDTFFAVGSGDGQTDIEGHVAAALHLGRRLGLVGGFRYGTQGSTSLVRRVAPPGAILAPAVSRHLVDWSPGTYTDLEVSPRFGITPALALSFDYRRYHKGADTYALTSDQGQDIYPVEASVLAQQTEVTLGEAAVGLRYNTLAAWRAGQSDTPLELGVRLIWAVSGAGGQVPKATRGELTVSLFHRLWGKNPSAPSSDTSTPTGGL